MPVVVSQDDLQVALIQLQDSRSRLTRALLDGHASPAPDAEPEGAGWFASAPHPDEVSRDD